MQDAAFQELMPDHHCFGCGPDNPGGLRLKSYWAEDGETSVAHFQPAPHHTARPKSVVNGGIIATVIDCHGVGTAAADAYREAGRPIGSEPQLWFVTGGLQVDYLRPAPIDREIELRGHVIEATDRKRVVACELWSGGERCARGKVTAVRVPESWRTAE